MALVCSQLMLMGVGVRPATAIHPEVVAADGLAYNYFTNVSLFGGPHNRRGYGQGADAPETAASPSVECPAEGGATSATDPDGARGVYGPAVIFGGKWPDESPAAPPSGPLTSSIDCRLGEGGYVTASTSLTLMPPGSTFIPPGSTVAYPHPGGAGPGPFIADEVHSTCTATGDGYLSGVPTIPGQGHAGTASTRIVNGILETKYDTRTQLAVETEPIPENPPPNYERSGTIDHVGDSYRIVFNEQVVNPDGSLTVIAAHMYLLGPTAVGDMVVGASTCGPLTVAPGLNHEPVATDDAYSAGHDAALTVPAPGVLANDSDPDLDGLTAATASEPGNGNVALDPDGSFTYTPDDGFSGTDTFTYTAGDGRGGTDTATVAVTVAPAPPASTKAVADFDGDGATDISVFRPATGAWHVAGRATTYHGRDGDAAVPADYDGDGDTDIAVFRPSSGGWYVQGQPTAFHGRSGDLPVPGDHDGDGDADLAVFRPSSGGWYVAGRSPVFFGRDGDIPVPGQYDADPEVDLAVFRPANGGWYVHGQRTVFHGRNGDIPVPADYDGDGDTDLAVFRPSSGGWYLRGQATVFLGRSGDVPVPGHYAGAAGADMAVFRPSSGGWYRPGQATAYFGRSGDAPLPLPHAIAQAFR